MATDIIRVSTHGRAATGTYTADVYLANSLIAHSTGLTVTVSSVPGIYTFGVVDPTAGTLYRYILRDSGLTPTWAVDGYYVARNDASTIDELEGPNVNATHWGGTAVASANVLIDGAVTSSKFAAGAINAAAIAADAIGADEIAAGAVTKIQAGLSTHTASDVWAVGTRSLTTFGTLVTDVASAVWTSLTSGMTTAGSIGKKLADWVIGSPMQAGSTVVLTDASLTTAKLGVFALAKGTNLTGFNDLSTAQVNAEADTALSDVGLTTTITGRIDLPLSSRSNQIQSDYIEETVLEIKAVTDQLTFTVPNQVDANAKTVVGTADDAVLAAIAALNNLSSDQVNTLLTTLKSDLNAAHGSGAWETAIGFATSTALTTLSNKIGTPAGASVSADIDAIPTAAETFAAVLTTALTESYAADGTAPTLAQAIFLIQQKLGETAIVGTTQTVRKLDGTTTAATYTLDSATDPTSITRAS